MTKYREIIRLTGLGFSQRNIMATSVQKVDRMNRGSKRMQSIKYVREKSKHPM